MEDYNNDFVNKVIQLNRRLQHVDKKAFSWALAEGNPFIALRDSSNLVTCVRCRNKTVFYGDYKRIICMGCNEELELIDVRSERRSNLPFPFMFCILNVVEDVQVIRTFKMSCTLHYKNGVSTYRSKEVSRHWFSKNGECVVTGLPVVMGSFIGIGKFSIRYKNRMLYDYYADIAFIYPEYHLIGSIKNSLYGAVVDMPKTGAYSFVHSILCKSD